jgi:hypothetical protein
LTTVTFAADSTLNSIGANAFQNTSLPSITIPNTVKSIGTSAFSSAKSLTTVTFAQGSQLEIIGNYAFWWTKLTSIEIPASVKSIGDYAFQNATSLTTVTFAPGSQLTSIGANAFQGATSLKSIPIPALVTSIGSNAFQDSGLKTAVFDSVTNVKSLGFTISSGQTFYGAQGVTISARDYSPKTPVTNYYYPGVTSSQILPLDTTGYTRCDVLIVGSGGNAGTVTYTNNGTIAQVPIFDLGGGGGGGGSASFTNITCNPLGGKIQFSITKSGSSSWVLNNWVKDGTSLGDCQLTAGNGGNGANPWGSPPFTLPVTGGAGGTSSGSSTGLPSGVVLTTKNGATGPTGIYGWSPPTPSSYPLPTNYPYPLENYKIQLPSGGQSGDILTNFKSPSSQNNNSMGYGSGYQEISGTFYPPWTLFGPGYSFTISSQSPGAAYIQVNLYNV